MAWWFLPIIALVLALWLFAKRKDRQTKGDKWTTRGGKPHRVDEVFEASDSGDLKRMLKALDKPTHPVDRHYLLLSIVQETYKQRTTSPKMRDLCERIAWQHLAEFPGLARALVVEDRSCRGPGRLPLVPTFQNLATLLTEKAEYGKAIEVCKKAVSFGLLDGTQSGFEGRIERIRKKQHREQRP